MKDKIIAAEIVLTANTTDVEIATIMQQVASLIYTDVTSS